MSPEGAAALLTTLAGCLIALSNSHTIRSWMEQKGLVKKAQTDLQAAELTLKYQSFEQVIAKREEEIKLLALKVEAVEISFSEERKEWHDKVSTLTASLIELTGRCSAAEQQVKILKDQQRQNILEINQLRVTRTELLEENKKLWAEINRRGGL